MLKTQFLPPLSAVFHPEGLSDETPVWVAHCPELDVTSQGKSVEEARAMLREAVELFLEVADAEEVSRRLALGGRVEPLEMAA